MKILAGNEDGWHAWRKGGIGGSDAPVIMGVSPYRTPFQLWLEKTGKAERDKTTTFVMDQGNKLERIGREKLEKETKRAWPPAMGEWEKDPRFRCSLDGWDGKMFAEFKFVGEKYTATEIKPEHYWQMIHYGIVTGTGTCLFIRMNKNGKMHTMETNLSSWDADRYLQKALAFLDCVYRKTAPQKCPEDLETVPDDSTLGRTLRRWQKLEAMAREAASVKKDILEIAVTIWPYVECSGFKIRKGRITKSKK